MSTGLSLNCVGMPNRNQPNSNIGHQGAELLLAGLQSVQNLATEKSFRGYAKSDKIDRDCKMMILPRL